MKKLTLSLLAVLVAGTSFAGAPMVTSKEFKQPVVPCFRDQEFALDIFYSYNNAEHQGDTVTTTLDRRNVIIDNVDPTLNVQDVTTTPQYFRDGSGGGVGLTYFFARYFGIGIEGNWWNGTQSGSRVSTRAAIVDDDGNVIATSRRSRETNDIHKAAAHQASGSLILRYPFEGPVCWAPYVFGGGGGIWDGDGAGFGHAGLGVEFRVTPNVGLFTDWRWNFMGGNHNDVNTTRAGVRFVF